MVKTYHEDIAATANAVLINASGSGEKPDTEAHLKSLARESLSCAGLDPQAIPERPTRDDLIASRMAENGGLVLFEIELIWSLCRAMANDHQSWRAALIPPLNERVSLFSPGTGCDDKGLIRVRGWKSLGCDTWDDYINALARFAEVFATALSGSSDAFVGIVRTADELRDLAGDGTVGQARIVERRASDTYHDPVGELQSSDELWSAEKGLGHRGIDVIAWQCGEVDGRGYDLGHLRGDHEHLSSLDTDGLREVIQLPKGEETQLFVWDGSYNGPAEMTTMLDAGSTTVPVFPAELRYRLDYTPSHYSHSQPEIRMATLGTLASKIQRGTSINGRSLQIVGTVDEPRPGARFDLDAMCYYSEDDLYYVDNASITGRTVRPRVVAEIPAGQERYTLRPEDGTVVLVARNGKGVTCYTPKRPTLVSNNLFIVRPDPEKAAPEYLSCAMRGSVGRGQMALMRMPMGKADLGRILVPVGPRRLMDAVVERELQIERERNGLIRRIQTLELEDPFDQMWTERGDSKRAPEQEAEEGDDQ